MRRDSTPARIVASGLEVAWENVAASFERFCLTAGIATLAEMMEQDATRLCGARHERSGDRRGYRWGHAAGKLGFHGGKVAIERPRVRTRGGPEIALPSWEAAQAEDWLGRWAMNLMLINVPPVASDERCACRKATSPLHQAPVCRSRRCLAGSWPYRRNG